MRYAKPLLRHHSLRNLCLAIGCGLALIASVPDAPAPAKADKAGAPANAAQATPTPDPCATPQPGAPPPPSNLAAICGKWGALVKLKTVPVHISLLPDGRLLYWGRDRAIDHPPPGGCAPSPDGTLPAGCDHWGVGDKCNTYTWELSKPPEDGLTIKNNTTNLFCSAHSFLPDGRLLVTGGHSRYNAPPGMTPAPWKDGIGERDVNIFDYRSNSWSLAGSMPQGRWYPSNVTLATGETVIASGDYWDGVTMQNGVPSPIPNNGIDLFRLNGQLRPFTRASPDSLWLYPYLHLAPDGRVFFAGPGPDPSKYFDPAGVNPDGTTGTFTYGPDYDPTHGSGSAVIYDSAVGKVMMVGGSTSVPGAPDTNVVETIDLTSAPFWKSSLASPPQVAAMNLNRMFHTATILPNGKVLVTGGTRCLGGPAIDCIKEGGNNAGAARQPELWTPPAGAERDKWTLLAPSPAYTGYPLGIPRSYHSVALLLPDARVLVGGGGQPAAGGEVVNGKVCKDMENTVNDLNNPDCVGFGHKDVEFFSPPYLFDANGNEAPRPVITSAPATVFLGQSFNVGMSSALPIDSVVLIRLPSVTHGFNFDQRRVVLAKQATSSTSLSVTAPADGKVCPPGHYMLFILDANGVPSEAKIIRVQRYEGVVEAINCEQIRGWAWDSNHPNTPVNVNLLFFSVDGRPQTPPATVQANLFRQDLLNASKGNGFHAFAYNVPLSLKDGRTRTVNAAVAGPDSPLTRTIIGALTCPASLFPTQTPASVASGEGATWEQATQFSSSLEGHVTHIAFYKAQGETGTHVGRIWNEAGVQLAQVTFTNETASGWQVQALPSRLSISPGVKYRVSYNINQFGAKTFAGLNTPITNGPLTAHTSYYSTPAGTFPTTNSGSILFADIRFTQLVGSR